MYQNQLLSQIGITDSSDSLFRLSRCLRPPARLPTAPVVGVEVAVHRRAARLSLRPQPSQYVDQVRPRWLAVDHVAITELPQPLLGEVELFHLGQMRLDRLARLEGLRPTGSLGQRFQPPLGLFAQPDRQHRRLLLYGYGNRMAHPQY